MIINYSPIHRWRKEAIENPAELYSAKNCKRINSSIPKLEENGISFEIKLLDYDFLEWFVPLYEKTIASKPNAKVHDIVAATINNKNSEATYYSFTLTQNQNILGGAILSDRPDMLITAYKIFQPKWESGTLQANPTLVSEYLTSKHAYEIGKEFVSHGRDRNPYGINASIGLCTFKLSVGYIPTISSFNEDYTKNTIETDTIETDALILHYPDEDKTIITEATLITTPENEEKYSQLKSYGDILKVKTLYRK